MVITPARPGPLLRLAHFVADGEDAMPEDHNNNQMLDPVVSGEWSMVESSESATTTEIEPAVVVAFIDKPRPDELCDVCSGPFRRGSLQVKWHTENHQVYLFHEECTITYARRRGCQTQVDMMTELVNLQPNVHHTLNQRINGLCLHLAAEPTAMDADTGGSQAAAFEGEGDGEEPTIVVTSPCQDGTGQAETLVVSSPCREAGETFVESQWRTEVTPDPKERFVHDSQFASPNEVPDTLPYSPKMEG
eukprot:s25_g7.t1